ncbi:MAG: hypothetical protein QM723_04325 [Myxococcaceae bacterium]
MQEPAEILDAVAADPGNDQSWHVLTDWLLENGAPHAILARYDLELDKGTRDPDLLGDYVEARRVRHQVPNVPGVVTDSLRWRCGYLFELSVCCDHTPKLDDRQAELETMFGAPVFRVLSRVILSGARRNLSVQFTAEQVLPALPKTVRRISVTGIHRNEPMPEALVQHRPPKAQRLDLPGYRLDDGLILSLARAGWSYLNLDRSTVQLRPQTLERLEGCTLMLGGAGLTKEVARSLDGPKVRWLPPGVTEALLDDEGRLTPLDHELPSLSVAGQGFVPSMHQWMVTVGGVYRQLAGGERLPARGGAGWLEYHQGEDLEDWYRAWLRA